MHDGGADKGAQSTWALTMPFAEALPWPMRKENTKENPKDCSISMIDGAAEDEGKVLGH